MYYKYAKYLAGLAELVEKYSERFERDHGLELAVSSVAVSVADQEPTLWLRWNPDDGWLDVEED